MDNRRITLLPYDPDVEQTLDRKITLLPFDPDAPEEPSKPIQRKKKLQLIPVEDETSSQQTIEEVNAPAQHNRIPRRKEEQIKSEFKKYRNVFEAPTKTPEEIKKMSASERREYAEQLNQEREFNAFESALLSAQLWTSEEAYQRAKAFSDKDKIEEKTREEIDALSWKEKQQYYKKLNKHKAWKSILGFGKGFLSAATFGASEKIAALEPQEDETSQWLGELTGLVLPASAIHKGITGIGTLIQRSPQAFKYVQALMEIKGMGTAMELFQTGLTGATYETASNLVKEGELPTIEQVVASGAEWAAFHAAFKLAGTGLRYAEKFSNARDNRIILDSHKYIDETVQKLAKENIYPEKNPIEFAERAEELLDAELAKAEAIRTSSESIDAKAKQEVDILTGKDSTPIPEESKTPLEAEVKPEIKREPKTKAVTKETTKAKKPTATQSKVEVKPKEKGLTQKQQDKPKPKTAERQPIKTNEKPKLADKQAKKGVPEEKVSLKEYVETGLEKKKRQFPSGREVKHLIKEKFYDRLEALKYVSDEAYATAQLAQSFSSTAKSVIEHGQYDYSTKEKIGPSITDIFSKENIKKRTGKETLNRDAFDQYLAARSSVERFKRGHKIAMPIQKAEAYIRQNPQYEYFAQELTKLSENNIANLRKAGIISKDAEHAIRMAYQDYAPLSRIIPQEKNLYQRVMDGLSSLSTNTKNALGIKQGAIKAENPLKKAKGSELKIESPTQNILRNTIATERAIKYNDAMKATGRGLEKLGFDVKEVKTRTTEKPSDLDITQDQWEQIKEFYDIYRPEQAKGSVRWFEDGKLLEVQNVPKDITQALSHLTPKEAHFVIDMIDSANKSFSRGVVLSPGTLMRLSMMDAVVATLQSKYWKGNFLTEVPMRVLIDYPKMFLERWKKGDLYQKYLRSGAAMSSYGRLDKPMLIEMTDKYFNANKKMMAADYAKLPIKLGKALVKGLEKTSNFLGDVPRLLEFDRSLKHHMSEGVPLDKALQKAAIDAWEVSIPYGKRGNSEALNFLYKVPVAGRFMNTIINSNVSFMKAISPKYPKSKQVWAMATSYLTLPTMALYMKNRNDPRYQAIPQEERDRNVYMWFTDDPNEEPFKLRKFWQFGWLFQTLPEHLVEFLYQNDPEIFVTLAANFEQEFSPFSSLSFYEASKDGKFDIMKLFEKGRYKLVPDKQRRLDAEFQHNSSTTEVAKFFARVFNIAPQYIEFLIEQTGGGLSKDALRLSDEAIYLLKLKEDRRPQAKAADSIFYGTFYGRGPKARSEYLNKFYEYVDKMDTIKANVNALIQEDRHDEAAELHEKYINLTRYRNHFTKYYKEIERIRKMHPNDLDGKAKRKELDAIYLEMTDVAKNYVEIIEDILKDQKKKD